MKIFESSESVLQFLAEARKRGVAQVHLEIAGDKLEAVIQPEPPVELTQKERAVLLDSPDVSESRKREIQQEIDRDLYGASQ